MSDLAPNALFKSESQINDGSNSITFLLYLTQVMGKHAHLWMDSSLKALSVEGLEKAPCEI